MQKHQIALAALLLSAACSKPNYGTKPPPAAPPTPSLAQTIPLTGDAYQYVQQVMRQGAGKAELQRIFDSLAAVVPVRRTVNSVTTMDDPAGSDAPGSDVFSIASYDNEFTSNDDPMLQSLLDNWWGTVPPDWIDLYNETYPTFSAIHLAQLYFPKRGNTVQVNIPYIVTGMLVNGGGEFQITGIGQSTPAQLLPVGAGWGDVTQVDNYVNGYGINMSVHIDAQEKRTEVVSTGGTIEISTSVNAEIFQAGAKLGANFTIQKAFNIYNQYAYDGNFNVFASVIQGPFVNPEITLMGTEQCVDTGVLLNS